ncbi:class F sortase [Microbispora sp. NEAU-D428]|uniref:class F sortase n=1 Tax=Microbispora sitophila TaxID=2771537 RepID=UPI0018693C26|nr:class F sortase [Microbispora sitophila]MBE3010902.1 class F sortase [Microbispora sitophila]
MPGARTDRGRRVLGVAAAAVVLTGAVFVGRGVLPADGPPVPPPEAARPAAVDGETAVAERISSSGGPALGPSEPRRLDIPKIGVHVALGRLGLNPDGTVQVPPVDHPEEAGWYAHGATPGERGAAVILGHVDGAGRKGVFYDLGRMRPGDIVEVGRADGSVAGFVVESVETVPKKRFPTRRVYGPLDHAGLRLVTCGGVFDRRIGHYTDNVILYARLTTP